MLKPSTHTKSIRRITAILISRFLLELQEANRMDIRVDPDEPLYSSRDPYSRPSFISSLGGFVNPAGLARSDDDNIIELQGRSLSEALGEEGEDPAEVPEAAA